MTEPRTVSWPYSKTDIDLSCFTEAKEAEGKECEICHRPAKWCAGSESKKHLCLHHRLLWTLFFDGWLESHQEHTGKEWRLSPKRWTHVFAHFVAMVKRTY